MVGILIGLGSLIYLGRIRPRLKREAKKQARSNREESERGSHPTFRWAGSSTNQTELIQDFQNEGGSVSELVVETSAPVETFIEPKKLDAQMTGSLRITARNGKLTFPIKFDVRYTTALNKRCRQGFWLEAAHRQPERLA